MFCKNCGNEIQENVQFCSNCGIKINEVKIMSKNKDNEIEDNKKINTEKNNIEKLKKNVKTAGDSAFAIGWITIIINIGIYLWSIFDINFYESGLPAPDTTGLLVMGAVCIIYIILGNRIKKLEDKKIKTYIQVLIILSLFTLAFSLVTGGRVGILLILLMIYLLQSLASITKLMNVEEFNLKLINPKYRLDKKGWIVFAITIIIFFFIALGIDLSKNNAPSQENYSTNEIVKNDNDTLEEYLEEESDKINKDLPIMLDEITQLTNTFVSGKDLIYSYILLTEQSITQNDIDEYLKENIINGVCTTSELKKVLDLGGGFIYRYYDDYENYLGEIPVHSSNCK